MSFSSNNKESGNAYSVEILPSCVSVSEKPTFYGLRFIKNELVLCEFPDICDSLEDISRLYSYFCDFDIDENHIFDIVSDFVQQLHF